jgi:hypothetical protein
MAQAVYDRDFGRERGPGVAVATADTVRTPFSWSAAIAGALAATAVAIILIALGSGIGLSFASPYGSGPSATTLTIAAAVWLVMAQSMGFATGGYLAGRLRSPAHDAIIGETTFRDAAQGFVVWALGVVAMVVMVGTLGLVTAGTTAAVVTSAAPAAAETARNDQNPATQTSATMDYFLDLMFRPGSNDPAAGGTAPANRQPLSAETRAEVSRILGRSVAQGKLDDADRAYLAQIVSARTGLPQDAAQQRVAMVETKAREAVKEAADKTAKAGAYFSFWSFMSLLFGGVAATLGGILGGQLRDEGRLAAARS